MAKPTKLGIVAVTCMVWYAALYGQNAILIPEGKVVLGNYPEGYGNYPAQVVFLPAYRIDKHEVTNQQFAEFVEAGGYQNQQYWIIADTADSLVGWKWKQDNAIQCPKFWDLSGKPYWKNDEFSRTPQSPVVGVSWYEACAYAKWAVAKLPSSAQWEKAARGNSEEFGTYQDTGAGYKYTWGNDFFKGQAIPQYALCNWRLGYWAYGYPDEAKTWKSDGYKVGTAPVGSYSPVGDSPYGVADVAGNVWEWCSEWHPEYPGQLKIVRGGGWYSSGLEQLKTAYLYGMGPFTRTGEIGFRCVR